MIVVMQCAGKKLSGASFWTNDGRKVCFVANPALVPASRDVIYARPDDPAEDGRTWRDKLIDYNKAPGANPSGLVRAGQLYRDASYSELSKVFGPDRFYILSAGWGLVRSDFLLPSYDITFKTDPMKPWATRQSGAGPADLRMLQAAPTEEIVFLGGLSYVRFFCDLTRGVAARRIVYHASEVPAHAPGCELRRYETTRRTNWHYELAHVLAAGRAPAKPALPANAALARPPAPRIMSSSAPGVADFRDLLRDFLAKAASSGKTHADVKSGDLHNQLRATSRMPSACSAMRAEMRSGDTIIEQPPSGNGSRLIIRYRLPRR